MSQMLYNSDFSESAGLFFVLRVFRGHQALGVLRESGAPPASQVSQELRASLAPQGPRYIVQLFHIYL